MPTQTKSAKLGDSISIGTEPYGAWGGFNFLQTSDNNYCEAIFEDSNIYTEILHCSGFAFEIPSFATIDGITLNIERKSQTADVVYDEIIQLIVDGGRTGQNKKNTTDPWETSDTSAAYGGVTDNWTISNLTINQVNSDIFGVAIQPTFLETYDIAWTQTELDIDQVELAITYTDSNDCRYGPQKVVGAYFKDNPITAIYHGSKLIVEGDR